MSPRTVLALLALVVSASLVGTPVTMHDWSEQADFSAHPIEGVHDEPPVLQYESLSPDAQRAVRAAIEHGETTVYGTEDWPDRFTYSDQLGPGHGIYIVVYEEQRYKLLTGGLGFGPPVEYVLPFVGYGLLLLGVGWRTYRDDAAVRTASAFVAVGAAFHLLGPEFDFPLLGPDGFVALGIVAALTLAAWLARGTVPDSWWRRADGS